MDVLEYMVDAGFYPHECGNIFTHGKLRVIYDEDDNYWKIVVYADARQRLIDWHCEFTPETPASAVIAVMRSVIGG